MDDQIYVVDPATREPVRAGAVSFRDIGVTERDDLERWIAKDPGLLGESLLVITSEFSRFDKSNRRLDILALDSNGSLVVVELKLDASRSLADQQAIRYAAMCSTMTMDDLVEAMARSEGCAKEEAAEKVRSFLRVDDLPELKGRPRIILAAGSIEDQELTSCVLWLRGFGVDISCVELTPYRVSDSRQVILVPRTIIPVREASDYCVSVESQKGGRDHQPRKLARARFWRAVAEEFNKLGMSFRASGRSCGVHMCLRFGCAHVHYEWIVRRQESYLDVALHFEFDDRQESFRWLDVIKPHVQSITRDIGLSFQLMPWGRKWTEARFRLPYDGDFPGVELAPEAARIMKILIERTWELMRPRIERESSTPCRPLSKISLALLTTMQRLERLRLRKPDD